MEDKKDYTFIDLFAGIGGFRTGFEKAGFKCVFSSEFDKYAQQTYEANFGVKPHGDITKINEKDIPDHDVLIGGFPCFIAGTMVLTMDGYKPIEEVIVGDEVLTHLGRWRKVTATMKKSNAEVITVWSSVPPGITCTKEHPFYIKRTRDSEPEFVKAEELKPGMFLGQVLPEEQNDDISLEMWHLVGSMAKDGHMLNFLPYIRNRRILGTMFSLPSSKIREFIRGYFSDFLHKQHAMPYDSLLQKSLNLSIGHLIQKGYGKINGFVFNPNLLENDGIDESIGHVDGRYGWKPYKFSIPAGIATVYNISVEEDESYIADGAIVHNCQAFSLAGKKLGFNESRGTLFFDVARIIKEKQPKVFVLENVKNLKTHDNGKTFQVIFNTLKELGYFVHYKILDASHLVPQHRERIFIVGFKEQVNFNFPDTSGEKKKLRDILEKEIDPKYTTSDTMMKCLERHKARHAAKGNGFGFTIANLDGVSRTLLARYCHDGSDILIPQEGKNPRKMTPRECARLMGFSDDFKIVCSNPRAIKQFGNSVVVPLIEQIAINVRKSLEGEVPDIIWGA